MNNLRFFSAELDLPYNWAALAYAISADFADGPPDRPHHLRFAAVVAQ